MPEQYEAVINGFTLNVETLSDGFQKSIVRHEFPHTNGALLEDLGQKARAVSVRCYFFNDAYDEHFDFLKTLDESAVSEFVHPVYGLIRGSIEKIDVRHNDREQTAEIDLTFVEGRIEDAQTEISMPGFGEDAFLDGQAEGQAALAADIAADAGAAGASAAAKTLDPSKGILEQFSDLSGGIRSYVAQVDAAVRTLEGTLTAITQPVNSLLATVNYAANLPGRVIGAVAQCVERVAETYDALRSFPARFQSSLRFSLDQLESSFRAFQSKAPAGSARNLAETAAMTTVANHIRLASSHRMALEAAYGFAADQSKRLQAKKNEGQKSFDALGNYFEPTAPGVIMTQGEIEAALASVMAAAQASVDLMRGSWPLKKSVSGLVEFARALMLLSGRIKQVELDGTLPLHLVLLKYGLPYNAADRILAINPQIRHPNFVSGTVNIYAQ